MARLIDADDFIAEHCADCKYFNVNGLCSKEDPVCGSVRVVTELPTIDAVEVVRCKDCKHWLKDVPGCTEFVGRCKWANYMVGATGYCVYGERKDNE